MAVKERAASEGKIPKAYDAFIRDINQKMKGVQKNYKGWIKEMLRLLTKEGTCTPFEARRIVEADAASLGISKHWVIKCLPDNGGFKNKVKQKAGRVSGRKSKRKAAAKRAKKQTIEAKTHLINTGALTPLTSNRLVLDLGEVVIDADGNQKSLLDAMELAIQRAQRFNTNQIRLTFDEQHIQKGNLILAAVDAVQPKATTPPTGTPATPSKAQAIPKAA